MEIDIGAQVGAFGERLRRYRLAAGLSQVEFAKRAGVDLAAVSFLERAKRAPNLGTIVRVARAAGVDPACLLEDRAPRDAPARGALAGRHSDPAAALIRFGSNLREARVRAGISQEALSQAAQIDRAAISIIERGGRAANLRSIVKLAAALGCRPGDLLTGVG